MAATPPLAARQQNVSFLAHPAFSAAYRLLCASFRLVGFGQEICKPVAPRCDLCDVATAKLCPSRRAVVASPTKKRIKAEIKEDVVADGQPEIALALERAEEVVEQLVVAVKQEEAGGLRVEERVVKAEDAT